MKSKAPNEHEDGFLEYIEYFININSLFEEANEKVETLDEERSEKLNRVKIVNKTMKKEAEDFLRDENTLALKQSKILLECKNNTEILTKAVNKLIDQLREEEEKHQLEKVTNEILEELANYEKDDINLEERKKTRNSKKKKVTMAFSTDRHGLSEAKTALRFNEQEGFYSKIVSYKGLCDLLGNLGVIDDKYDVAISIACPALNNIAVDSVEVGHNFRSIERQPSKIEEEIKILQDFGNWGDKLRAQKSKIDHVKDQHVLINERIIKSQVANQGRKRIRLKLKIL
ncbi:14466_t:CDS:2 [Funneliformis caledonium]|uniref:14466_t:CDS:1 n=1 Tax=Funneliformis caledonium TaxID=1117310 RepID=A0A9N9GE28_9GLOM|nr:14466_t:CDS:2 [Funneliformis caledonium]